MPEFAQSLLPYVINGMALGMSVALVALALALIWRTAGMIDFGLGAVYLISAYTVLLLRNEAGLPLGVAIIGAVIMGGLTGIANYFCLYRFFISVRPGTL